MIRIQSGWCKGLSLETPDGLETRPTRSRVRESCLNLIQPWIANGAFLDLCAGSGAVGIEFLSRGGRLLTAVENSKDVFRILKSNLAKVQTRATQQSKGPLAIDCMNMEATEYLKKMFEVYDVIWADPPYASVPEFLNRIPESLHKNIEKDGIFFIETAENSLEIINKWSQQRGFSIIKQRKYGVTLATVMQVSSIA